MSKKLTPQLFGIIATLIFAAACAYVQGRSDEQSGTASGLLGSTASAAQAMIHMVIPMHIWR